MKSVYASHEIRTGKLTDDVGEDTITFYNRIQGIGHVAVHKGKQPLAVILAKSDSHFTYHAEGAKEEMTLFSLESN